MYLFAKTVTLITLIFPFFSLSSQSIASDVSRRGLLSFTKLTEQADGVVVGTIKSITYSQSDARAAETIRMPLTFVEVVPQKIFNAKIQGQTLTLRFAGGKFKSQNGRNGYSSIGNTPVFQVGQKVALFVKVTENSLCPLVGCESGVFFLNDDKITSAHGQELYLLPAQKNGDPTSFGRVEPAQTESPELNGCDLLAGFTVNKKKVDCKNAEKIQTNLDRPEIKNHLTVVEFLKLLTEISTQGQQTKANTLVSALPSEQHTILRPRAILAGKRRGE